MVPNRAKHLNINILTHLQCDAAITIPELSNDEVCVSEQYPRLEAHMITKTEIISLGYL